MTLNKNLGRHSLPSLRRISSRDLKLPEEVGRWFLDRYVSGLGILLLVYLDAAELLLLFLS
jgi:hypothetical protein